MPYICASGISTSLIWLASSRVGASTRPARVRQEIVGAPFLGMPLAHLFHLMAELAHVLVLVGVDLTQSRDQRNRERQGLAGAGTASAENVTTGQESGRVSAWIGKAVFLPSAASTAYQRAGNAEFGERLGAFLLLARLIEIGGEGIFIFQSQRYRAQWPFMSNIAHVAQTC